jgi:hypothetical protein
LRGDLAEYGFTRKPLIVNILADSDSMVIDQPERLRMAVEMGITRFPTSVNVIEPDSIFARCGPGTPVGSSGVSGESTPDGGASVQPGTPVVPPPVDPIPEPPASPS